VEEDSNERIYRIGEEGQEGLLPGGNSATTAGPAASMASGEKMNSMTSTTTNYRATKTTHPATTTSTGNSTRKTIEAAEAGTLAD
jgi:hypothetical protein